MDFLTLKSDNKKIVDQVVDYLNSGKVVVLPTDTVYGLHCLAENKKGIEKIFNIKEKSKNKSLLILVNSIDMLHKICNVSKDQVAYLDKIWLRNKQAITAVLKAKDGFLGFEKKDTLAVRLPNNDFLIRIINSVGKPIVSTSLNIHNQQTLKEVKNLERIFIKEKPDLVVDGGVLDNSASQVIDLQNLNNIKVIRK